MPRARASKRNSCVDGNFPVLLSARRIFPRKFAIFKKLFRPYIEEGRESRLTFEFLIFSSFERSRISQRNSFYLLRIEKSKNVSVNIGRNLGASSMY